MKRLTLVTALFDLARREGNPRRRNVEHYMRAAEYLFDLDADVIAFADPELADGLADARRLAGHEARTVVVPLALEELPAHELAGPIVAARRAHPILNGDPDKDTPLYAVLQWSKFELVRRATDLDPFDATHYGWLDIGLPSRPHPADRVFEQPADRVRLLAMRGFREADLADAADYLSHLRGHVAAGYVTASAPAFMRLCERFDARAREFLEARLAPSEEQLLPILCLEEPELFEFHYGDYGAILSNYLRLRGSAENLIFQLRDARAHGDFAHGHAIGSRLLESVSEGTFECHPHLLSDLLDEAFIAAWYDEGAGPDVAGHVASVYAGLVQSDPDFRDAFLRDEIRIRSNFASLPAERRPL